MSRGGHGVPVLAGFAVCPVDHAALIATASGVRCTACGTEYPRGEHGYLELVRSDAAAVAFETTNPHYASVHLPSYRDVRRWFDGHEWRALPMRGFFGFAVFDDPAGRPGVAARLAGVARCYVEGLPGPLRGTALNPYILVEVIA